MRAVLVVSSIALVACRKDPDPPAPAPPPAVSSSPVASASSSPSTVAAATTDAGAGPGDDGLGASAVHSSAPVLTKTPPHRIDLDEIKAAPPIPNAEMVIARGRGSFLQCYKQGLDGDPKMAGDVRISVKVGADGTPTSSDVMQNQGNVSSPVASCAAQRARKLVFAHPQGEAPSLLTFRIRMVLEEKQAR